MVQIDRLSERDVELLQQSFQQLKGDLSEIVADLYPTFLSRYPQYAEFFEETDFSAQRKGVERLFESAIPDLNNPDRLSDTLDSPGGGLPGSRCTSRGLRGYGPGFSGDSFKPHR
ncbi:MAG: hypothetical protein ABEJ65_10855 [bacterium]